ncbi:O-antigen polymerase [Deinococcus rubellus]|uniref:Oligosaccharide repeat unit polymerase n=1 Tax=Deinococcus rubellus TaxID=1889240 RepID=A0ABY5YEL4_9DEIO|nr:O-antigen polymerase [Deinococcus rubellus]UWX63151.1 oligosaccharide repeat unit polymerase [Deinococcus rubellus]
MINLSLLYQIYKLYGDAYNIFHYGGSTFYTQSIQEKSLQYINILAKFNYIAPNFLIPLIFKFEKRFLFVIMPFLILQGAFAVLYGTRIVIMTTILTILIAYTYRIKIDLKNATLIFATLLLVGVAVISGQSIRQNVSFGSGLTEVKRYYSTSLNNGSSVIENNLITQKLFWTLRPVLSIPFLPKATGFINMYEKLFGKLQIRNRKEDFSYAAKLGFDPAYNTFSSFGYAYLDLGRGGIFLLLLGWLTIQYIYIRARSGQILYLIIFPAFYISMLDQLRTYWFFSESNMYSLLSGIFILSLIKLASLHSKNKIYDQEKDI